MCFRLSAASVEEAMDTLPSVRNDPEEKAKWIEEKPLIDYKIEMNEQRIKSLDYKVHLHLYIYIYIYS